MSHVHCFDVIVVDDLIIDLLLELPEFPEPEKVILPLRFERQVGGNGNFLIMASRLGLSVKAIGCIGNDSNGRFLKESLLREGVNVEDVFIKSGLTKTCFVLICNGSKAFIGGLTENTVFLQSNDIKEEMFNGKALYFSSYSLIDKDLNFKCEATIKAFNICVKRGLDIFFDATPLVNMVPRSILNSILKATSILFINIDELRMLTGKLSINESLSELKSTVKGIIVVKLGDRGALAYHDDIISRVDGVKVIPIDTTGAGDAFNAAFIYGYMRGLSIEHSLYLANIVGALTVERFGAGVNLPMKRDIEAFIKLRNLRCDDEIWRLISE